MRHFSRKRPSAIAFTLLLFILSFKLSLFPASAVETSTQSFVSGTPVWTESGPRPIESLVAGDLVWVEDEEHGQVELKAITAISEEQAATTLLVNFTNGEQIEATTHHPIYVEGSGFRSADQLAADEAIITGVGPSQTIASITSQSQSKAVYSFPVADCNTCFVGQSGFWVSH